MWHFHVTIFVALESESQKSTVEISLVVNFPAWSYHVLMEEYLRLSFGIRFFARWN